MLTEELSNVLRLVADMPPQWQARCIPGLMKLVEAWEDRQSHFDLSEDEWLALAQSRDNSLTLLKLQLNRLQVRIDSLRRDDQD